MLVSRNDRHQPRPLGRRLDALVGCRFLLPVVHQHDETVDPDHKHDGVLVNPVLGNLDKWRKRNGPEKEKRSMM